MQRDFSTINPMFLPGRTHPSRCPGYYASCPTHLKGPMYYSRQLGDAHWVPCLEKPRKLLPKRLRRAEQQQRVEKDSKQRTSRQDWGIQKKPHQQPLYAWFFLVIKLFVSHYRIANLTQNCRQIEGQKFVVFIT